MTIERSHHCGSLRKEHIGLTVELKGWVQRRRDLGGLIFIDLRDRSGIVQVVFHPEDKEAIAIADKSRSEYLLAVKGTVIGREEGTVNSKLPTGEIEIKVSEAEIINTAKNPPFMIQDEVEVDETIRLKYRYLDLRRPVMQNTFMLRHKAAKIFRDFLDTHGFLESRNTNANKKHS